MTQVRSRAIWKHDCDDIDDARVYGGIQFRFEQKAGARWGGEVGNYILKEPSAPAASR